MPKRFIFVFMMFCVGLGLFLGSIEIKEVKAIEVEVTRTFTSQTYDGRIYKVDSNYSDAWSATSGTVQDISDTMEIGQMKGTPNYVINRIYCFFETGLIPNDANITEAVLSLYVSSDLSTTDFNITMQDGQPTYPHFPLESGDYFKDQYSGNGGNRSTSEISGSGYWNITLNSDGQNWINEVGTTKFCLRSSEDISGQAPTGVDRVFFYTYEKGESYAPKLYVTYETEGYNYLVHGPYFEDGSVADNLVNLTFQIENMPNENYILNGTDGVVDTLNITCEQRGVVFTWNVSGYDNTTRAYYLTDDAFEEIWIFVPDYTEESAYLYTFTINDLVGVTNAYLESIINIEGQNRIVERQSLDVVNNVPFWMVFSKKYDMRIVCDQGTYTWSFIALTEQTQSLIIVPGMFPETYPGLNVTVTATRMNTSWIQINYTDEGLLTTWVYAAIKCKVSYSFVIVKSYNQSGNNTAQFNWYSAISDKDYVVKVTSLRGNTTNTWSFDCSTPADIYNPWDDLADLGEWPIEAKYLVGLLIVLCVFGVTSYINMPAGCVIGVIVAGILNLMGWLNISWSLLCLAFALAIFAAIRQGKKREYELEGI